MPVAFKTSATDSSPAATSTTQIAIATPGTVTDGDFLLVALAVGGGANTAVTLPNGWTQLLRSDNSVAVSILVAYKFAQGEPPTTAFSFSTSNTHAGAMSVYTGVDQFFPFDATATNQNAASTNQPAPAVTVTGQASVVYTAYACTANRTFTLPTGYIDRGHISKNSVSVAASDTGASAGAIASVTATISTNQLGASCTVALRSAVGQASLAQVDSALKALFPPGADDLYDWNNSTDPSELWKLHQATAGFLKAYVYDYVDLLRQEVNPLTAVAKLPEWEGALGITQNTASAVNKWIATRQAAVVSKLRESGATTLAAVGAVLEPLLGYSGANAGTLQVIECNRAALTTAHTYANSTGASIGSNSSVSQTVDLSYRDGGAVSAAGVQVQVTITCTNPEQLSFSLTGPAGTNGQAVVTWASGSLPVGSATSTTFYLYEHAASAGKSIQGVWSFQINTGAATCTLVSWSLFVEGIAAGQSTGGAAFEWGAYADPLKYNSPDLVAAANAITRIQPGYSLGRLLLSLSPDPDISSGSLAAIPDQCIPV